eukprot:UC1_evm1s1488
MLADPGPVALKAVKPPPVVLAVPSCAAPDLEAAVLVKSCITLEADFLLAFITLFASSCVVVGGLALGAPRRGFSGGGLQLKRPQQRG